MASPKPICSVDGCGKQSLSLGLCQSHYSRMRRNGHTDRVNAEPGSSARWLEANVGHTGDVCIVWPFATKFRDYGGIRWRGRQFGAHRVMCILAHGEPPAGDWEAAHSCNNPLCCNPNHLRWATPTQNHADKIASGTTSRGAANPKSRLSEQQARTIKYDRTSQSPTLVGKEFGVDASTVIDIRKGRSWAWL